MVQTNKAQENQAGQQTPVPQNQSPTLTEEAMQKLLAPMQETIAQLKADKEAAAAEQLAKAEAARRAQVNKEADIQTMLGNVDTGGTSDDAYENMSKRQLVEIIAGAVETAMEANATKIKNDIGQSLAPSNDKMAVMEKAVMGILGNLGVQEARGKHDDFDDYQEDISKIMGNNPGLTFERAYLLAKSERAGNTATRSQIDSEKPSDSAWAPEASQGGTIPNQTALQAIADRGKEARDNAAVTKSGTVGIRNIIAAGVAKVQADKQQQ